MRSEFSIAKPDMLRKCKNCCCLKRVPVLSLSALSKNKFGY